MFFVLGSWPLQAQSKVETKGGEAKKDDRPDDDLFKALSSADAAQRKKAQEELVRRGDKHRPTLLQLLKNEDHPLVARQAALETVLGFWNEDVQEAAFELLKNGSADLRLQACNALAQKATRADKAAQEALL